MLGWFRRHAKVLMVVLGSAAMAIFGLGPAFERLAQQQGGGGPADTASEVIAQWDDGEISRSQLDKLQTRHYQTQRFLDGVVRASQVRKADYANDNVIPILPLMGGQQEAVDHQLVTRMMMAKYAEKQGFVASDGMAEDYLVFLSDDAGLTERDLKQINREVNTNVSYKEVLSHLKMELMHSQMAYCSVTGIPRVPNTTESIELHSRMSRQIECQVIPIDVKKSEETPSTSVLKKLYEEGKYDFSDPLGVMPGFKENRKLNIQYLVADYNTFLQNEINKLTEEDVQQEYDRLVSIKSPEVVEQEEEAGADDFQLDIPSDEPASEEATPEGGDLPAAPPTAETPETEMPAAPAVEAPATPVVETPATPAVETPATPAVEVPAVPAVGTPATPAIEVPTTGTSATPVLEKAIQKVQDVIEKKTSAIGSLSAFQLVSMVTYQDDAAPAPPATPVVEAGEVQEESGLGAITESTETPAATEPGAPADEKPVKIKPLKDCVEAVKRSMAEGPAREAMNEATTKAGVIVRSHFEQLIRLEAEAMSTGRKGTPPAPFDLEKVAADYGLVAHDTGLKDFQEMLSDQIGRLQTVVSRPRPRLVNIAQRVFQSFVDIREYQAEPFDDNWGSKNRFLYWVSEKQESRVPSFDECQGKVIEFWQQRQGVEATMASAQKIQKEINDARTKTLRDQYGERVVDTGAFSWLTGFGEMKVSQPSGVPNCGDEFMETAFGLAKLEAGIALNEPKDKVFVVQLIEPGNTVTETSKDYIENQLGKFKTISREVISATQYYGGRLNGDWNEELNRELGLKFIKY